MKRKRRIKRVVKISLFLMAVSTLTSCGYLEDLQEKSDIVNNYEKASLNLARENRRLQGEISRLKFEIQALKTKNNFYAIKLGEKKGRSIASIGAAPRKGDAVKFEIYKWPPDQVLAVAETEFEKKNYERSAQFYKTFLDNFPEDKRVSDQLLFQAGYAAYESGKHYKWAMNCFKRIRTEYPSSKFYRGAKLWSALIHLKWGEKDKFFNIVEEFRKKYRNTSEWKLLSAHYEEILQKYKN